MRKIRLAKSPGDIAIRRARLADLDALWALENEVFATDRMSRRGLRRLIDAPSAVVLVAQPYAGVT